MQIISRMATRRATTPIAIQTHSVRPRTVLSISELKSPEPMAPSGSNSQIQSSVRGSAEYRQHRSPNTHQEQVQMNFSPSFCNRASFRSSPLSKNLKQQENRTKNPGVGGVEGR
uniref:Uncharacterized protein n=1 Tax=Arundo donax TaxID=35708 RepID=A0A0A9E9E4_ARUDO